MLKTKRAFFALIGRSSPGAQVIELDGVQATICPAVPERSLPNSVVYGDQAALIAALPELAARYDAAGVDAWTVWAPEEDKDAIAALDEAGHVLDATPLGMSVDLAGIEAPPELDYREGPELLPVVLDINDNAYAFEGTPFSDMSAARDPSATRNYVAYLDGEPAAGLTIIDVDGDAGVYEVATLPEARGHGLAGRLLLAALREAHERGCDISTLQATKMGAPVYERLGYRSHGAIEMWERRR